MSKLKLADELSLPIDACTQTFAWIGRKGSGKTYGAGKLAEELLEHHVQVVILDTVGNWYGLRIAADGKSKGFDVPVFGGLRQDLPLLSTAGDLVADVVMDSRRSVILDVSQFNFSERKRFAADFGTRLWQRKKGEADPSPLHLVIEECQLIVPQFVQKDDTRMVHVYEEIIRLGRNYGIGCSMLTQRPQSVNKEVLTQAECIMAFQINGVPERKALKEWLTYEGGDVNLVNELPGLPVGNCYLWSPQWLRTFKQITIGKKATLDASATPKAGQKLVRRDPAPLDVTEIEARMVSTIEKAKADDPKQLQKTIRELRVQVEALQSRPGQETIKEVPIVPDKDVKFLGALVQDCKEQNQQFMTALDEFSMLLQKVVHQPRHPVAVISQARRWGKTTQLTQIIMKRDPDTRGPEKLGAGELKILTAVAQDPDGVLREQLTVLTGYKRSSRDTYLQRLAQAGFILVIDGRMRVTSAGETMLGPDFEPLPRGSALQDYWKARLTGGERVLFEILTREYPKAVDRDVLTEQTGYKRSSRDTFLQRLAVRQLITTERGTVRASEMLFE